MAFFQKLWSIIWSIKFKNIKKHIICDQTIRNTSHTQKLMYYQLRTFYNDCYYTKLIKTKILYLNQRKNYKSQVIL